MVRFFCAAGLRRSPRACCCWAGLLILFLPDATRPGLAEEVKAEAGERLVRERFQTAYQAADKPALRADTVLMLKGVKEAASKRLLTGMLGDPVPTVKRNACRVMAETEDLEGYFVKPLTAVLGDRNYMVRSAAAEALGSARLKSLAVKALVLALSETAREGENQTAHAKTIHLTLTRLTGKDLGKVEDFLKVAPLWHAWWQEHRERLEREDEKYLEQLKEAQAEAPLPVNPEK